MIEPRKNELVGADAVRFAEGSIAVAGGAWHCNPTGVLERGMHALGLSRNLGGPRVSARVRAVPPYEVNAKSVGTDTGESECLSRTEEAGELTREDPVEGREASGHGIAGGKDGRESEL